MDTLPLDDLDLKDGIAAIVLMNDYNPIMQEIAQNLYDNGFDRISLISILQKNDVKTINKLKSDIRT